MNIRFITEGKRKLGEEKGSALVSVLIVFTVVLILIASGSSLALRNFKTSKQSLKNHSAYYIAESQAHQFQEMTSHHIKSLSKSDAMAYKKAQARELGDHLNQAISPLLYKEDEIMKEKVDYRIILIPDSENPDLFFLQSMVKLGSQEVSFEILIENIHELIDENLKID